MVNFDKWTLLKLIEVILVIACLVFKRVTDDEARSVFLYLQKLSREWSLLNNITWDRIGAAVADATYGGYVVITVALLVGRIVGELPTTRRVSELMMLGVGAVLFIVLGSLEYASLDSVPHNLIDNAAILGTLSLVTGALFLLDMGGPKAKKSPNHSLLRSTRDTADVPTITQRVINAERESAQTRQESQPQPKQSNGTTINGDGANNNRIQLQNGHYPRPAEDLSRGEPPKPPKELTNAVPVLPTAKGYKPYDPASQGYRQMRDEVDTPKRFGIYGKDVMELGSETDETESIPPKMEQHSPVWSQIRKGRTNNGRLGV